MNVDPFDARLDDELERARLRRVFRQGLDATVGWLLPLKREWRTGTAGPQWVTGPWFVRDERLYLIPGDSPMGYRLPLDSLPWAAKGDQPWTLAQDPFAPQPPLPVAAECATLAANALDSRKLSIYGGSNEVQRNLIARAVLAA